VATAVQLGRVCVHPYRLSSHPTPRASIPRLSIMSIQTVLLAASELDLPPFCITMNISNMAPTTTEGLYLCQRKDGSPYSPPSNGFAWKAPAIAPTARLRAELPIPPLARIFFLDPDLAKSRDHGFRGLKGIRTRDFVRITGKTTIKGGGRIGNLAAIFETGGRLWEILEIHGWLKERGVSAAPATFFIAMTDGHEMVSSPSDKDPRQWLLSLS
jgi:hypothetical protein